MAESDSPRLGLRRWSAGTDTPSRIEFDTGHANLDDLTAIDKQGTFGARPAAGVRGTYYWDTTNIYLWRDDGAGWATVGSRHLDGIVKSSAVGVVPLTVDTIAGQTADLFVLKRDGVTRLTVNEAGDLSVFRRTLGSSVSLTSTETGQRVIDAIGANGQTADLFRLRVFSGTEVLKVNNTGEVTGAYLNAGPNKALLGNSAYSNVANMLKFDGTPALEVYAAKGGASGAFNDFIYLRHLAVDATAVTRRLGLLMKAGDEAVGDAAKSGAILVESTAANFANPKLILQRANADVMTFDSTPLATVHVPVSVSGRVTAVPGSDFGFAVGQAMMYAQGNWSALRTGSGSGFNFFQNSSYSATPGDAGSGTSLASLDQNGEFNCVRYNASSTQDATLATSVPAFEIGSQGAANLIMSVAKVQARNNGAAAMLTLNGAGGNVDIGGSGSIVDVPTGAFFEINGRRLTIANSAPGGPSTGDVWIDT